MPSPPHEEREAKYYEKVLFRSLSNHHVYSHISKRCSGGQGSLRRASGIKAGKTTTLAKAALPYDGLSLRSRKDPVHTFRLLFTSTSHERAGSQSPLIVSVTQPGKACTQLVRNPLGQS